MKDFSEISDRIFDILKGYGYRLKLYNDEGNKVYEPSQARRFFAEPDNFLVSLEDNFRHSNIGLNFSEGMNIDILQKIIKSLKSTASHYNINFNLKKFGHVLSPGDFAYKNVTESKDVTTMWGGIKTSYQRVGTSKIIIKHFESINPTLIGSRARKIKNIFIETKIGEKYRYPYLHLAGARAMARHLSNNGLINDQFGNHIIENSMTRHGLNKFVQNIKHHVDNDQVMQEWYDIAHNKIKHVHETCKNISKVRGYNLVKESLQIDQKTLQNLQEIKNNLATKLNQYEINLDEECVNLVSNILAGVQNMIAEASTDKQDQIEFYRKPNLSTSILAQYKDKSARLAYQISELAASIKNDQIANKLSSIVDQIHQGRKVAFSAEEKQMIQDVMQAAKSYDFSKASGRKSKAVKEQEEFMAWANSFDPTVMFKTKETKEKNKETQIVSERSEEFLWVLAKDVAKFKDHPKMIKRICLGLNEVDTSNLILLIKKNYKKEIAEAVQANIQSLNQPEMASTIVNESDFDQSEYDARAALESAKQNVENAFSIVVSSSPIWKSWYEQNPKLTQEKFTKLAGKTKATAVEEAWFGKPSDYSKQIAAQLDDHQKILTKNLKKVIEDLDIDYDDVVRELSQQEHDQIQPLMRQFEGFKTRLRTDQSVDDNFRNDLIRGINKLAVDMAKIEK